MNQGTFVSYPLSFVLPYHQTASLWRYIDFSDYENLFHFFYDNQTQSQSMGTLLFPEQYYCTKYGITLQSPPDRTPTQHQPLSNIIFPIMLNNIMLIFQTYIYRGLYHYLPLLQSSLFYESFLLFVLIYATICQNIISEIAGFSKMSGKKYLMFTKIKVIINPTEVFKWGYTQDFFPASIMPFLIRVDWT